MGCVYCAVESQCLFGRVDAEMHKCFCEGYFLRLMKIEERIIKSKSTFLIITNLRGLFSTIIAPIFISI